MNLATTIEIYGGKKLHYKTAFQGLPISVENRKGSVRKGCDKKWGCWQTKMKAPYGYVRGTKGMDGQEVDVFIGPKVDAKFAYVITTMKQPEFKQTDEQKVMLGFPDAATAKRVFLQHFDDTRFFGKMEQIPMQEFKEKVLGKPGKIEADIGEPGVYDGGYSHIEPRQIYHPPSLKKPKRVPVDNPGETDDEFLDVTKRRSKATKARRDSLTKQHTDQNMHPLSSTRISGMPAITIGGFG